MQQRFYLYVPGDGTYHVCYQEQLVNSKEPKLEDVAYFLKLEERKMAKAADRPKLRYVLEQVDDYQWRAIRPFKRIGPNYIDDISHADHPPYSIEVHGDRYLYEDRTEINSKNLIAAISFYLDNEELVNRLVEEQLP